MGCKGQRGERGCRHINIKSGIWPVMGMGQNQKEVEIQRSFDVLGRDIVEWMTPFRRIADW
jgi:hypothetical protein